MPGCVLSPDIKHLIQISKQPYSVAIVSRKKISRKLT